MQKVTYPKQKFLSRREIRMGFGKSKANGLRVLLWGAIFWLRDQKLIFSQFQKQEICCQDELLHRFLCTHPLPYLCACLWINSSFPDTPPFISTPLLASLHLTCLCLYLNFIEVTIKGLGVTASIPVLRPAWFIMDRREGTRVEKEHTPGCLSQSLVESESFRKAMS